MTARLHSEVPAIQSSWDDLLVGIEDAGHWQKRRETLRKRFLELIRDEAKPPPVPKDTRIEDEQIVDGSYRLRWISYQTESEDRALAAVGIPLNPTGPLPGVVALHGTTPQGLRQTVGLEGAPEEAHLDHLCRRGFAFIAPEHFVSGTRIPPEGPYDTKRFYDKHPEWTAVGKFTYEHSLAVDILSSLPEVDASRLGVMGHSLGGHGAYFLAAYDERLKAAVCNCGSTFFRHNPQVEKWARDRWYIYFRHLRESLLRGEAPPIDMHEIIALIAPRAFLDISAWNDPLCHIPTQRQRALMLLKLGELYGLLEQPQNLAFYIHGQGHAVPPDSKALICEFLAQHLKQPD